MLPDLDRNIAQSQAQMAIALWLITLAFGPASIRNRWFESSSLHQRVSQNPRASLAGRDRRSAADYDGRCIHNAGRRIVKSPQYGNLSPGPRGSGSFLGGFRTPALSARTTVTTGRHPKPFTKGDVKRMRENRLKL